MKDMLLGKLLEEIIAAWRGAGYNPHNQLEGYT